MYFGIFVIHFNFWCKLLNLPDSISEANRKSSILLVPLTLRNKSQNGPNEEGIAFESNNLLSLAPQVLTKLDLHPSYNLSCAKSTRAVTKPLNFPQKMTLAITMAGDCH